MAKTDNASMASAIDNLGGRVEAAQSADAAANREILNALTRLLDQADSRDREFRRTMEGVSATLRELTAAFGKQNAAIEKLLDIKVRFRDLETAFIEEQRENQRMRTQLAIVWRVIGWGGAVVTAALTADIMGWIGTGV